MHEHERDEESALFATLESERRTAEADLKADLSELIEAGIPLDVGGLRIRGHWGTDADRLAELIEAAGAAAAFPAAPAE